MSRPHRRLVIVPGAPAKPRGRPRVWGYTTDSIAKLAGVTPGAVSAAIRRGLFDPEALLEVAAWINTRRAKADAAETRAAIELARKAARARRKRILAAVKRQDSI